MSTLLLRLRGPMMSWGDHSRFSIRDSQREPTKSAVIGLLCAALGRPRSQPVADLAVLKMGVRVNQEGMLQCDYHTVMSAIKSGGGKGGTTLSYRYYIADGDYLVGLEDGTENGIPLETLDAALRAPQWQLYLGRKSFLPSRSIPIGIVDRPLQQALEQCQLVDWPPKQILEPHELERKTKRLRYVLETNDSTDDSTDVRRDVPLDWQRRLFGSRRVTTDYVPTHIQPKEVNA